MGFRLAPEAAKDLEEVWQYVAQRSGSPEIANRLIESILNCCWMLGEQPYMGRRRDEDLSAGLRSFPVGEYVILYRIEEAQALILKLLRGSRDLPALFRD